MEVISPLEDILKLFDAAQRTAACHQKNSLLLRRIYQKWPLETFWEALLRPIDGILQIDYKKKNAYVDRMIEFIGVFCGAIKRIKTDEEENFTEEPLIAKFFEYLLQASECITDTVRFRSCQLINKTLEHLANFQIGDHVYERMLEVLMDRLSDSKAIIRLQAIEALYRVQDPHDSDDPLIFEFIQLLHDSQSAKVRRLIVERIALRRDIWGYIVKRTRDTDVNVRLAAFRRLSPHAKRFKIVDRRLILFTGFYDISDKVRDYVCNDFLTSWLECYNNDILQFMKSLRLDADEKDLEGTMGLHEHVLNKFYFKKQSLEELIKVLPLNDEKLLPYDKVNWETITYWRLLITLLTENVDRETQLENVAPELVFFCRYIKEYLERSVDAKDGSYLEKQFIIKQLFHIIRMCDLSDTHTIKNVHELIVFLLRTEDLMDNTVEAIIGTLTKTVPNAENRCRLGMEIISNILIDIDTEEELRRSEEKEYQLARLQVQIALLKQDQENAIANADFMEADRLKHSIEDVSLQLNNLKNSLYQPQDVVKKKDDLPTICKCLDIAWAILRCANVSKLTPTLNSLKVEFLPEFLVHKNGIVALKALRCYVLCSLYDKPTARQGIHMLAAPIFAYQAGEECDTQTLLTCISAVSDLIRIFGQDLLAEPHEDQLSETVNEEHQKLFTGGTSLTSLFQGLTDLMDDEQFDVQLKGTEGLCKCILSERIHSPALISRLILKWCHPIEQEDSESQTLKQFIGHVLGALPHLPNGSEQLEGAVLLTINTLARAPRTSPLANVDIDNIAKFMLALCKTSPQGQKLHCNIGLSLCEKINQNEDNEINRIYSKMLLMIDLPEDQDILKEMFRSIEGAKENINEKVTLKNITKFLGMLDAILRNGKEVVSETLSVLSEDKENEEMGAMTLI